MPYFARDNDWMLSDIILAEKGLCIAACDNAGALVVEEGSWVAFENANGVPETLENKCCKQAS